MLLITNLFLNKKIYSGKKLVKYFGSLSRNIMSDTNNNQLLHGKHKIAICQITCKENKEENFNICKKLITEAKNEGAEVKNFRF